MSDPSLPGDRSFDHIRHALNNAPAEEVAPTQEQFHALAMAVKVASTPSGTAHVVPPNKWSHRLMEMLLKTRPPVDARFQNGRTSLMLAPTIFPTS